VIESAGRQFPVAVEHAGRDVMDVRDLAETAARAVRAALSTHQGDVLVFLPGMGEIRRTQAALVGCGATVLPLHGELPPAEQDLALRMAEGRRVVLSTSIAETSLTVPGVRIVIDGGWRRTPRLDPGTGLSRLATVRISRAAADQRAGRAGREGPGVAIRLWTTAMQRSLPQHDRPEILEAELSGFVLDCASWGTAPQQLPFLDKPPAGMLAAGAALLEQLGAMSAGRVTPMGQKIAALGAHPRLGAMMLAARNPGEASMAADLSAILEERDPLPGRDAPARIDDRLEAVAGRLSADRGAVARIRQQASQYRRRLNTSATPEGKPGSLLAMAFPDRIAQRREPGSFRFSGGGGAKLPRGDSLSNEPFLVVAGLDPKGAALIRLAAPLDIADLPPQVTARISELVESGFDSATGSVLSRRRRRLGALILEDRTIDADPAQTAAVLAAAAVRVPNALPWTEAARQLQARAILLHGMDPETPDLSDAGLAASVQDWLAPHLLDMRRLAELASLDLAGLLRAHLGRATVARLDKLLPTHLSLVNGRAAVDYCQTVPVASAKAQVFYGLNRTPTLADGRIPLRLALLSPAGRPIAVTADLAGFWQGAWSDARRDMRGRYPRHDWPENPAVD
jgi:ATP-dependent helicase HrpB